MDKHSNAGALVEILRTDDAGRLPLVKSLLDSAGIPYLVQGEGALGLIPTGILAIGLPRPLIGAIVRVPADYAEEARTLLETPPTAIEADVD